MKKLTIVSVLALVAGLSIFAAVTYAADLTGNEILQKVDEYETAVTGGNLISTLRFDIVNSDGTTTYEIFGGVSRKVAGEPEKSLIYFIEPEDVAGTIFLSIKPVGEDARMWLYLPALGSAKEIVAEQKKQSFAGSTFSYKDIGSRSMADKYTAEVIGEEAVTVEDESYDCYVLELTAKPDSDADYPTGKMWVDKTSFLLLKSEDYNSDGKLERTMEVTKLGDFEGKLVADKMIATNVLDNSSTTITFIERVRPEDEIPDSVFDPDNLASFDPSLFGFPS